MSVLAPPPVRPSAPPTPVAPTSPPKTYGRDPSAYRFTVSQYERMIAAGILTPADKIELLEGYLVLKMSRDPSHDGTIDLLSEALRVAVPKGWIVRCQGTLKLADSNPEPDFAIVRGTPRSYLKRHPEPADTALVAEVANTSLERDLDDKSRVYARAGIPVYWVIDVTNGLVEVFEQPSGPGVAPAYASRRTVRPPESLTFTFDGTTVTLPAAELLP